MSHSYNATYFEEGFMWKCLSLLANYWVAQINIKAAKTRIWC